jgi:hypothetical protein
MERRMRQALVFLVAMVASVAIMRGCYFDPPAGWHVPSQETPQ